MDRSRFEHLLEAYGAEITRWPAGERAAAEAFASAHAAELSGALTEARALDAALASVREKTPDTSALARRILAAAPARREGFSRGARLALAACAIGGVLLGYGGGLMAPASAAEEDYFHLAFEAPFAAPGDGG